MSEKINRRGFIQKTALAGAGIALAPSLLKAQGAAAPKFNNLVDPSRKIRIAAVGCGGQGVPNLTTIRNAVNPETKEKYAEFVAFCDVDFDRGASRFDEDPHVPRYKDYRKMFAEMKDQIDAVVVTTPDHMHYPVASLAISLGKHVYVEKPATHTIGEARALKALAKKMGVVTQMGNHGHAYEGCRLLKEWIDYGVIGDLKEIHIWTNRPGWPQGIELDTSVKHDIPATLDWNLWLGVSPEVPFSPNFVPFNWRGMWNWGTGAIGDMACHMMDPIFTAVDLRGDVKVTPSSEGATDFSPGKKGKLVYEFAPNGKRKALKLTWYEGGWKPKKEDLPEGVFTDEDLNRGNGMIYIGTKGVIMDTDDYGNRATLMPKEKMDEFNKTVRKEIPKTIPRVPDGNSRIEFLRAIIGGPTPGSNLVDHSADLTELGLLGILAFRMDKVIDWDYKKGIARGLPEANKFIHKDYRMF